MPIRTEAEYRAALARLDAERVILASRSFTDDEQRDFEALVRDIETYKAGGSPIASTAPTPPPPAVANPAPSPPPKAQQASALRGNTAADMRASMEREIRRAGMVPLR